MGWRTNPVVLAVILVTPSLPLHARDPGPIEATGRGSSTRSQSSSSPTGRFIPERVDPTELHGKRQVPAERRRLYERVEADADRGRGRIEDGQSYDARRRQDEQDERA